MFGKTIGTLWRWISQPKLHVDPSGAVVMEMLNTQTSLVGLLFGLK